MATEKHKKPFLTTELSSGGAQENIVHLLPRPGEITEALLDVMENYDWKYVGVIYEASLGRCFKLRHQPFRERPFDIYSGGTEELAEKEFASDTL